METLRVMNTLPEHRRHEFRWQYEAQKKDRTAALLLSLFAGNFGADRFYLGQAGLGIAKLLTLGGCGIWWIVDLFLVQASADKQNMELILELKQVFFSEQNAFGGYVVPGQGPGRGAPEGGPGGSGGYEPGPSDGWGPPPGMPPGGGAAGPDGWGPPPK